MKNSWVLFQSSEDTNSFNYYCKCSHEFTRKFPVEKTDAPEILCPKCGNDYFIDTREWEGGTGTRIWKEFSWEKEIINSDDSWSVNLFFTIPRYSTESSKIIITKQSLMSSNLSKTSDSSVKYEYHYPVAVKYSLFIDDRTQELKKLLIKDSEEYLFSNIMKNRSDDILWIKEDDIKGLDVRSKLDCIRYFMKHTHLQDITMFHWKMPILQRNTTQYNSQLEMLDYILEHKKEKSLKKSLYKTYKDALNITGYYPYSDFIFSRSIKDKNFLAQLLSIYPAVKQHIFTDETFTYAIEFIGFLKLHYSEKQISELFLSEMQNESSKIDALLNWRDTLRLIQAPDSFDYLDQYFLKVKLTTKNLHDEITRVSNLAAFDRGDHSALTYNPHQNGAQVIVDDLKFVLPEDTVELSIWAKELHNCMFGYVHSIKNGRSIIYGVFRDVELLYAVELRAMSIAQALGKFNKKIEDDDMDIIKKWHNEHYVKNFT